MTQASFADDILDASMAQATGGITSERLDALEHTAFVALQRILERLASMDFSAIDDPDRLARAGANILRMMEAFRKVAADPLGAHDSDLPF